MDESANENHRELFSLTIFIIIPYEQITKCEESIFQENISFT